MRYARYRIWSHCNCKIFILQYCDFRIRRSDTINRNVEIVSISVQAIDVSCFSSHTAWQISSKRKNTIPRKSTDLSITKRRPASAAAHRWIMALLIATVDLMSSLFACWPQQGRDCLSSVIVSEELGKFLETHETASSRRISSGRHVRQCKTSLQPETSP